MTLRRRSKRALSALLLILVAACTAVSSGPAGTSPDLGSETGVTSGVGLNGQDREILGESSVPVFYQDTPKTERAIGVVGLAALIVALGIVALGMYKLLQALGG